MNQQSYQSLTNWFYQRPILNKILVSCCRLFPYSMFFLYAVGSVCLFSHFLFYGFDAEYLLFWIIPAVGFVLVSLLRKKINAPRPYDLFDFTPLIGHESGASCPSRHTACAFLIFSALLWIFLHNLFPILLVSELFDKKQNTEKYVINKSNKLGENNDEKNLHIWL